jgi:hypothetical protein
VTLPSLKRGASADLWRGMRPPGGSNLPGVRGTTPWPFLPERLTILWFSRMDMAHFAFQIERQDVGSAHCVPVRTQTADRTDVSPSPRFVLLPASWAGARAVGLILQLDLDPELFHLVHQLQKSLTPQIGSTPLNRGRPKCGAKSTFWPRTWGKSGAKSPAVALNQPFGGALGLLHG